MIPELFMRPERLWWLVLIPVLIGLYLVLIQRRRSRARGGVGIRGLEKVLPKQQAWKRHVAVGAAILALGALNVAFAQPKGEVLVPRDRATVVIALDVSRSMMATDVQPDRMDAAKAAAIDFVNIMPPGFNVALVRFAGTAAVVVPPTTDHAMVTAAIQNLEVAPSTAIGDGIFAALDAIAQAPPDPNRPDDVAPGAIVLLSDGSTNSGRPSGDAAKAAKDQKIPIYTIAYGTDYGYVESNGQRQPVPVDHYELQQIANISGGKKFAAGSSAQLKEVYSAIAHEVGMVKQSQEVTELFAGIALLFAVVAALSLASLAARWP
jgi:Ca-activated chloride channel family protein